MADYTQDKLTRRSFLFGLASVLTLSMTRQARASVGLFEPFSFAYVTDVHLATGMSDTFKMLQESQLFLQDAVKQLNAEKLDFVIFGGDQVERPGQDDANWQLFLDVAQTLTAPWTFVLGEQDVSGPPAVNKMKTYGPDWKGKGIETETPYWSQSPLPGVHIVGLDTSRSNSTQGDLSPEQLQWLKDDLNKNTRRFTIVFSHHPLLPPAPFDGGPPWDDYIVSQGATAREILGSSKYVRLALSGHVHMTKIQKEGDIWYVSGPSLGVYPCAYRIFRVTPDDITVETYQISFPALVKKARQIFAKCPLAFKYNERKPEAFAELADGSLIDQDAVMPLTAGSTIQPLKQKRRKKAVEETPPPKAKGKHHKGAEQPPEKPAEEHQTKSKKEKPTKEKPSDHGGETSSKKEKSPTRKEKTTAPSQKTKKQPKETGSDQTAPDLEKAPDNSTAPKPDSSAAPKPDSSAAPQPDSSTAPKPDSSTAPKPDSSTAPKPDSSTAPQPDSSTAPTNSEK